MTQFDNCQLRSVCKTQQCSFMCYPYTFLHGLEGQTGLWKTRNIPKKYDGCLLSNLPQIQPKLSHDKMVSFIEKVVALVEKGIGLFLFSVPSSENPLGTGTGKTTVATTIINEFLISRTIDHLKNGTPLESNPVLFLPMSDFQNIYNAQFRGNRDSQEQASEIYYRFKERMKKVELLVIDDIAMRNASEAFVNEFYEIVNHRVNRDVSTIYTSNEPLSKLTDIFGERIVSRIEGSTSQYPFTGKDHRRKGW